MRQAIGDSLNEHGLVIIPGIIFGGFFVLAGICTASLDAVIGGLICFTFFTIATNLMLCGELFFILPMKFWNRRIDEISEKKNKTGKEILLCMMYCLLLIWWSIWAVFLAVAAFVIGLLLLFAGITAVLEALDRLMTRSGIK